MSSEPGKSDRIVNAIVLGLALLTLVGGIVLMLAVSGVAATVAGIALVGLAGISLVSLAFLLVGQGEDRDRLRRPRG
jgi:hypothetical protein